MTALYIISFILLVVATVALLKLTPEQINKDINELFNKQQTLKDQALMARGKKRKNRLILELERIRRALQETGKEKQFSLACTAALLLMVYGENVFDPEGRVIMKQMADLLGVRFQPLFIRLRQFGLLDYHPLEELLMKQILESEVYA